jgi:hypothetical protein
MANKTTAARARAAKEDPKPSAATAATASETAGADTIEAAIDAGIGEAVAGRRPLPTPEAEAAAAIAEAPVNPIPGSGTLDDRGPLETRFEGLSKAEITALNAYLAAMPAADLELFRAKLAEASIDPVASQGALDDRDRWSEGVARTAMRLQGALTALSQGRALPPVAELDAQMELDPEKGPWLKIRATRDGHRRAGRAWSTAAAFVSEKDLTAEQIVQLTEDPSLIVEEL